jgi:hypothetical protein
VRRTGEPRRRAERLASAEIDRCREAGFDTAALRRALRVRYREANRRGGLASWTWYRAVRGLLGPLRRIEGYPPQLVLFEEPEP